MGLCPRAESWITGCVDTRSKDLRSAKLVASRYGLFRTYNVVYGWALMFSTSGSIFSVLLIVQNRMVDRVCCILRPISATIAVVTRYRQILSPTRKKIGIPVRNKRMNGSSERLHLITCPRSELKSGCIVEITEFAVAPILRSSSTHVEWTSDLATMKFAPIPSPILILLRRSIV